MRGGLDLEAAISVLDEPIIIDIPTKVEREESYLNAREIVRLVSEYAEGVIGNCYGTTDQGVKDEVSQGAWNHNGQQLFSGFTLELPWGIKIWYADHRSYKRKKDRLEPIDRGSMRIAQLRGNTYVQIFSIDFIMKYKDQKLRGISGFTCEQTIKHLYWEKSPLFRK